jgi:hypothetical protein
MDTQYAIQRAGSKKALARVLGISRQAIQQWGPQLPPLQAYRIKEIKPKWVAEWKRLKAAQAAEAAQPPQIG